MKNQDFDQNHFFESSAMDKSNQTNSQKHRVLRGHNSHILKGFFFTSLYDVNKSATKNDFSKVLLNH